MSHIISKFFCRNPICRKHGIEQPMLKIIACVDLDFNIGTGNISISNTDCVRKIEHAYCPECGQKIPEEELGPITYNANWNISLKNYKK